MTPEEVQTRIEQVLGSDLPWDRLLTGVVATGSPELPYPAITAAYGAAYAVSTARVSGMVAQKLQTLTGRDATGLLARIACECESMGAVPEWLSKEFAGLSRDSDSCLVSADGNWL